MSMKTFGLAAAMLMAASSVASAQCAYGHDAKMASTPVEQQVTSERVYVAEIPAAMRTDAWLVKYLDDWQKA